MTQYNLPISIADVLLEYHMRNWRDELQKAQIGNPSSKNQNAMGVSRKLPTRSDYSHNLIGLPCYSPLTVTVLAQNKVL